MSAVYNLRTIPNGWQVNKFDDDFNLESSYEMTQSDGQTHCGCPAGQRPSCRHRQMFPMLQTRVDSPWFLDFDTRKWVDPTGTASEASSLDTPKPEDVQGYDLISGEAMTLAEYNTRYSGPQGSLGSEAATPKRELHEGRPTSDNWVKDRFEESPPEPEKPVVLDNSHPFRRRM